MAQGNLKLKSKQSNRITKKQQNPKKLPQKSLNLKTIAKESLKLTKIHLGQLMKSTEKLIASRVGHLELIKGSRRQVEKENKQQANKNKSISY